MSLGAARQQRGPTAMAVGRAQQGDRTYESPPRLPWRDFGQYVERKFT
jgi:hypothetical protein